MFRPIPDDNEIHFYRRDRQQFGFLSNFFVVEIRIDRSRWPHNEAYYQAQKSLNPDYRDRILAKDKPAWAKYVGDSRIGNPQQSSKSWFRTRPDDLRTDWDQIKIDVMRKGLHAKFTQHAYLSTLLLATENAKLVEDSSTDDFWGWGQDGCGQNHLGVLLMELRETLLLAEDRTTKTKVKK